MDFSAIVNVLGYSFKNPDLLKQALTHRSFINECEIAEEEHNERLEFLGDAVVDLSVGSQLMERLPQVREGELSKLRAMVVSEASLAYSASQIDLGNFLRLGKGEEKSGGRLKASILADAFEALLGAIFLDGGYDQVDLVIRRLLGALVESAVEGDLESDHKTRLQEFIQRVHKIMPVYKVVEEHGPDHAKVFKVAVYLGEKELAVAEGASKKMAEQRAARLAMKTLETE